MDKELLIYKRTNSQKELRIEYGQHDTAIYSMMPIIKHIVNDYYTTITDYHISIRNYRPPYYPDDLKVIFKYREKEVLVIRIA